MRQLPVRGTAAPPSRPVSHLRRWVLSVFPQSCYFSRTAVMKKGRVVDPPLDYSLFGFTALHAQIIDQILQVSFHIFHRRLCVGLSRQHIMHVGEENGGCLAV